MSHATIRPTLKWPGSPEGQGRELSELQQHSTGSAAALIITSDEHIENDCANPKFEMLSDGGVGGWRISRATHSRGPRSTTPCSSNRSVLR